jgi:hypothetical protein
MDNKLHEMFNAILEKEGILLNQLGKLALLEEDMTEITGNFLKWFIKYCDEHEIPFWREEQFENYIKLSRKILKEISDTTTDIIELIESRKLPLNKFRKRSPEDLPEPAYEMGLCILISEVYI